MNRRAFLSTLAAGLSAAAVDDPERLIWTRGKKLISIAKPIPKTKLLRSFNFGGNVYSLKEPMPFNEAQYIIRSDDPDAPYTGLKLDGRRVPRENIILHVCPPHIEIGFKTKAAIFYAEDGSDRIMLRTGLVPEHPDFVISPSPDIPRYKILNAL